METAPRSGQLIRFKAFELDLRSGELRRHGLKLKLQGQPIDLLAMLLERPGELVSREELRKKLWPDDAFVDFEHGLNSAINRLREALGDSAETPRFVETLPRRGYRFIAPIDSSVAPASTPLAEPTAKPIVASPAIPAPAPVGRHRARLAILAVPAALLAGYVAARLTVRDVIDQSGFHYASLMSEPGTALTPRWSPKGDSIAYSADVDGVFQIFIRKVAAPSRTQITRMANDCILPFWSRDGARLYFTTVDTLEHFSIWTIAVGGDAPALVLDNALGGALTCDGRTLAFLHQESPSSYSLWLSSPTGADPAPYRLPPFDQLRVAMPFLALDTTREGRTLGVLLTQARVGKFYSVPLDGGKPVLRYTGTLPTPAPGSFCWLSGGRQILAGGTNLSLVNLRDGRSLPVRSGELPITQPSVSPDGRRVAYELSVEDNDILEIPVDGSGMRVVLDTQRDEHNPSWSPSGRQFAYSSSALHTSEILLYDPHEHTHTTVVTSKDFPGAANILLLDACISPDGKRLAFRRVDLTGDSIWITTLTGDTPVPLWNDPRRSPQGGPVWSPDGNWIAYYGIHDGRQAVLKARIGGSSGPELVTTATQARPVRWSPRGDWIASNLVPGIVLTSPDGKRSRKISDLRWLTFGFSNDGDRMYGLRLTGLRRLVLASIDVETGRENQIADLGPMPPSARAVWFKGDLPFRGFSMAPDGKSFLTSIYRDSSSIWMLEGFDPDTSLWRKLLPRN